MSDVPAVHAVVIDLIVPTVYLGPVSTADLRLMPGQAVAAERRYYPSSVDSDSCAGRKRTILRSRRQISPGVAVQCRACSGRHNAQAVSCRACRKAELKQRSQSMMNAATRSRVVAAESWRGWQRRIEQSRLPSCRRLPRRHLRKVNAVEMMCRAPARQNAAHRVGAEMAAAVVEVFVAQKPESMPHTPVKAAQNVMRRGRSRGQAIR